MSAYYELVAGGGGDENEDDPAVLAAQAQAGQQLNAARRVHEIGAGGDAGRVSGGGGSADRASSGGDGNADRASGGVGGNSALRSALMAAENQRLDLSDF